MHLRPRKHRILYSLLSLLFACCLLLSTVQSAVGRVFDSTTLELKIAQPVAKNSLTAVLPVISNSLSTLQITLAPFLGPSTCVLKVVIICPEPLLLQARASIRHILSSTAENSNHPDISLYPWSGDGDPSVVVLQAASRASTKWLLLLDHDGLQGVSAHGREMLLCPVAFDLPVGPRGVIGSPDNHSCAFPSPEPLPAAYLVPPFVLPRSLIQESVYEDWADFGRAVSQCRGDQLGGVVWAFGDLDPNWCSRVLPGIHDNPLLLSEQFTNIEPEPLLNARQLGGLFVFLLPHLDDLRLLLPLVCRLYETHSIKILLYSDSRPDSILRETPSSICSLAYHTFLERAARRQVYPMIYDWLTQLDREPNIIFAVSDPATHPVVSQHATIIRVPHEDLKYVHWMSSLSLAEWTSTTCVFYLRTLLS